MNLFHFQLQSACVRGEAACQPDGRGDGVVRVQGGRLPNARPHLAQGRQGPPPRRRLPALRKPVHRRLHLRRQELHGRGEVCVPNKESSKATGDLSDTLHHRSTSSLTVEDLEKKPRKVVEIVTPLENQSVKYGEPLELSVKGVDPQREGIS